MSALLSLAERVEAATGADRELGREVLLACGKGYVSPLQRWMDPTASLDAAMTLVPANHTVQLSDWDHEILRAKGPWQAIVLPIGARGRMKDYTFTNRCDHAATPALALTAACLRALDAAASGAGEGL